MEHPIAFDLNRAITQWRESMAQAPAMRHENLDELEEHLRDGIKDLRQRGLSEREALLVATGRIGSGELVAAEYGKMNRTAIWLDRAFWLLIGMQVWGVISGAATMMCRTALLAGMYGFGYDAKSQGNAIPTIAFTVVQLMALAGSAGVCGWLFLRKGRSLGEWLAKMLRRRMGFVAIFCGFYFLSLAVSLFGTSLYGWFYRLMGNEKYVEFIAPLSMSMVIGQLVWAGVLMGLTLFLARRRFLAVAR